MKKFLDNQKIPKSELGLIITSSNNGSSKLILDINANKKMIPASITKVLTSAAVLNSFPPGYKFKTQLLLAKDSMNKDSSYKGDICLKGGGDPSFVSENMWYLVNKFSRLGFDKIKGNIIVDDTLFDSVRFDESRQEHRVDRAYDAPVGAMSFNWNSVNIFIRPSSKGKPPRVFIDPDVPMFKVNNKAVTSAGSGNGLSVDKGKQDITITGSIGENSNEIVFYKNIKEPDIWSGENLKLFLAQRDIKVTGNIVRGACPKNFEMVSEYESKSIESILTDMNKFSNNFVAEMLTKNLSLSQSEKGNLGMGMKVINDYLKSIKLPKDSFEVYNPSGLTRENKITPKSMVLVLERLHNNFSVFPEFVSSLPIAGIDGTLKKRMKGSAAERWVRAKTGYLTNVVALAGYAGRSDGNVYQFAFIFNGRTDESKIKNTFDKILNILLE
ncbi:MAG: D-alanyl-D-alanine carboxypeptidase/D-alanyl-D-alanine-endopeptidase [Bdellovibrionales bacterium]|nr:D-alanyl-D-alanine carboxypeptidase/D-alanyl-D-alanine-endopeptidase [Bdellovibrionales bacterium]